MGCERIGGVIRHVIGGERSRMNCGVSMVENNVVGCEIGVEAHCCSVKRMSGDGGVCFFEGS